ncbi:MAG: 16S rRNA (guanine(527)-N(7))-methyltransferase RsmG [Tannerella sp.]|jgi:16S rRNA (guanine527-N7)-methyltransferase|nr:16S rRNA (guanine(527)-N(7))-methyltransferase RsmG [Tannerella sp.]
MNTLINKYFTDLTEAQREQFDALGALYSDWNAKINVISRKDIDNLYERHVLHSLGIARFLRFVGGSSVMDVGTGGGFPGIPLAILFPDVQFLLIDGIAKKIKVAQAVVDALGLPNVKTRQCRVEEEKAVFDFVVSRAVMPLPDLARLVRKNISNQHRNALPNGLVSLKGGDVKSETAPFGKHLIVTDLSEYFEEEFFETKKVIYVPI